MYYQPDIAKLDPQRSSESCNIKIDIAGDRSAYSSLLGLTRLHMINQNLRTLFVWAEVAYRI